jgi:hypothetical protein
MTAGGRRESDGEEVRSKEKGLNPATHPPWKIRDET